MFSELRNTEAVTHRYRSRWCGGEVRNDGGSWRSANRDRSCLLGSDSVLCDGSGIGSGQLARGVDSRNTGDRGPLGRWELHLAKWDLDDVDGRSSRTLGNLL